MFAEDLTVFLDTDAGFAVSATVAGTPRDIIFDAPGADALSGDIVTTEPSALIQASFAVAVGNALVLGGLPAHLAHLAGTYTVRSVLPEPPDGAFVRAFLAKVS